MSELSPAVEPDLLKPLVALVADLEEAELQGVVLPLALPGLLERFLDPETQKALPPVLRPAADRYLGGLPGYRWGDWRGAAGQHDLRLALWNRDAQRVEESDIEDLGLEEESGG